MYLEIDRLSYAYGDFQALHGLSFACERGEIVGLIGGNGAGKSTTIKNIVRHLTPASGQIRIGGKDISAMGDDYPVSYIPDTPVFFDELSVLEHLQFMKAVYPMNKIEIEALLTQFELEPYLNTLPFALSKGTRQKLMIAIALLKEYEILIADEPFTGLDPSQVVQLKRIFAEQKRQGKLVLLSSHLLDVAENLCDRFAMIQKGRLAAFGSREELLYLAGMDMQRSTLEEAYMKLVNTSE